MGACIHSPLFSGINVTAELTEGSAVVYVFHFSVVLTWTVVA